MSWFILIVAGVFEVGWAVGLKHSDGFTRPWPTAATIACIVLSMGLLGLAARGLPIGTAYAVWTGIGTVGTAVVGIMVLGEPATGLRLACLVLIVAGIVGLKLVTPDAPAEAAPAPLVPGAASPIAETASTGKDDDAEHRTVPAPETDT